MRLPGFSAESACGTQGGGHRRQERVTADRGRRIEPARSIYVLSDGTITCCEVCGAGPGPYDYIMCCDPCASGPGVSTPTPITLPLR
jgi:hypothetical protein